MALGRTNINLPEIPIKPKRLYLYREGDNIANFSKNASYGTNTVTFNANNIYMYGYYPATSNWYGAGITTAEAYNLTRYSKVYFELEGTTITGNSVISVGATSYRDGTSADVFSGDNIAATVLRATVNGVIEVPIDNVVDIEGYVKIQVYGSGGKAETYVKNIWLE